MPKNFDMILPGERQSNSGWAEYSAFRLAALSLQITVTLFKGADMLSRSMLLAAILTVSGCAVGQTAKPANLSAVDADRTDLTWHGLSIDKLEDMDLYNSAGKKIGEVEDVLADGSGQLSAVGVGFGGPLGADDDTEVTEVVVPLDRLRLSQDGHLTGDLSESDLAQLPEWDN
jgi:sporulation protein YlmC with PRC-barrel domain